MNRLLLLTCVLLLCAGSGRSQILNAGFESWTGGEPDNWTTSNSAPFLVNIKSSSDAHSGAFSLRAQVDTFSNSVFAPVLQNHYASHKGSGVNTRVSAFTGWIKFHSDSGDALQMSLLAGKGDSAIGAGSLLTSTDVIAWDQVSIPMTYYLPYAIPDTIIILCTIKGAQGATPHLGSWFELDDLAFAEATDAVEAGRSDRFDVSVFPNPISANAALRLSAHNAGSVRAEVFDEMGRSVKTLIEGNYGSETTTIPFNASWLPDGMYYLRVQSTGQTLTRSVVVRH